MCGSFHILAFLGTMTSEMRVADKKLTPADMWTAVDKSLNTTRLHPREFRRVVRGSPTTSLKPSAP